MLLILIFKKINTIFLKKITTINRLNYVQTYICEHLLMNIKLPSVNKGWLSLSQVKK